MTDAYRRHDISDHTWSLLEPHLPGRAGDWGGVARNNRLFINAVFWILRTGAPWRDLPPSYGGWKNTHRRFCRWRDKGVWEALLEQLIDEPDYEWLMIGMWCFYALLFTFYLCCLYNIYNVVYSDCELVVCRSREDSGEEHWHLKMQCSNP